MLVIGSSAAINWEMCDTPADLEQALSCELAMNMLAVRSDRLIWRSVMWREIWNSHGSWQRHLRADSRCKLLDGNKTGADQAYKCDECQF